MGKPEEEKTDRYNELVRAYNHEVSRLAQEEAQITLRGKGPLPRTWETPDIEEGEIVEDAEELTPEQAARIDEINDRIDALVDQLAELTSDW